MGRSNEKIQTEELQKIKNLKYFKNNKDILLESLDIDGKGETNIFVVFNYGEETWKGAVPLRSRAAERFYSRPLEAQNYIKEAYEYQHPSKKKDWVEKCKQYKKELKGAHDDLRLFTNLAKSTWRCNQHGFGVKGPNDPRRIQALKTRGFVIGTKYRQKCKECNRQDPTKRVTYFILLRIPKKEQSKAYETFTPKQKKKILKVLGNKDVFDEVKPSQLVIEHKFPEERWDKAVKILVEKRDKDKMTDAEIQKNYQLMSNQKNEHKRVVCLNCMRDNKRGRLFGINFFYKGDENWPKGVPRRGKEAEKGCEGCGWYDVAEWKKSIEKCHKSI